MSRIHDALQKAEQERMSGGPASAAPPLPPRVEVPAAQAATLEAPPPSVFTQQGADGLTVENLAGRCVKSQWKPDSNVMIFFAPKEQRIGMEEFRTLRSRLYQIREARPTKKLIVASALPAEGKSFVAANLAQAFVRQHGRRALLIDGDLRWSRLHMYLGAPSGPGLSEYLSGDADEFAITCRGPLENLYFIPGGKAVSNPAELIANKRLKTLLDRMASLFDWIILDSPPAIPVSDASLMADYCDGVVLVVSSASTSFEMAQKARQEFRTKPVLGVVLNRVSPQSSYNSYYSYYYRQGDQSLGKDKKG